MPALDDHPEPDSAEPVDLATLKDEHGKLKTERDKLKAERDEYRALYLRMLEQCRKLELGIVRHPRERIPDEFQLSLALLDQLLKRDPEQTADPVAEATQESSSAIVDGESDDDGKPPRKPRRKPLPEALPRVEIEVLPPEVEHEGLDAFERIGEDACETLERRHASLVVVRVVRPKFVRKDRERNAETTVAIAAPVERPIERGIAGPALLAETIVRRWADHLPLHRLEQIYAREGALLPRSTICAWHLALHQGVMPLVVAMWKDALDSPYLCVDATGVLVQVLPSNVAEVESRGVDDGHHDCARS